MNEQLQARIQQFITDGKSPAWIANMLYAEDESVDYDGVMNYASEVIEQSKKKDLESQEEAATPLIASLPSEGELDSSSPQSIDVRSIGREYLDRFKEDQMQMQMDIIEQDEVFAQQIAEIQQSDKTDAQKQHEINSKFQHRTREKQRDLFKSYSDEISQRIEGNETVDPEQYANILYRDFGLPIPLDGDDRYNESTFFGGGVVDWFTDLGFGVLASSVDLLSGSISTAGAQANTFMPSNLKEDYARQIDQRLSDFAEGLRKDFMTQYSTSYTEKLGDVASEDITFGDVGELFSRATTTVAESVPTIAAVAANPLVAGAVFTQNSYVDSKREDYNREVQGLDPIFEDSFSGNSSRALVSLAEGSLTAAAGGIQAKIASGAFKKLATNPNTQQTFRQFLVDYARTQGVDIGLEGVIEATQEGSTMVLQDALGNIDYSSEEYTERLLESFVLGIASSGAISAGGLTLGALDAKADVVTRPQAAANSIVEKNNMTADDLNNIESLNNSNSANEVLNSDFNEQLHKEKLNKEVFYRMITMRYPGEMKQINDLDIAIAQANIRYKRAKKEGATDQELENITRDVFNLVDRRMQIVEAHKGESTDLTPQEKARYEDGRVAKRMQTVNTDVSALQEQLEDLKTEALIPFRVRPEQIADVEEKLFMAKEHKTEALRLMGELEQKRKALKENRTAQTEAEAYIAMENLRSHLGLVAVDQAVELKATPDEKVQAPQYSAKAQLDNHNEDQENKGSTFNARGENLSGQPRGSVSIFPERSKIVDGDITEEDLSSFREDNADLLDGNEDVLAIGTWFDSESGKTYLDISAALPKDVATELGRQYNQKAVWDLELNEEIDTGGTGEATADMKPEADRVSDIRSLMPEATRKPVEKPAPEPVVSEPETLQEESDLRGIEGEFDEYQAKEDGTLGISSLRGMTSKDIRFINKVLVPHLRTVAGNNYKIVAHNTEASGDRSSKRGGQINSLAVENADGSLEIHLNLNRLAEARKAGKDPRSVIMEENLHIVLGPALRKAYATDPKQVNSLIDGLEKEARKSGDTELVSIVEEKGRLYREVRDGVSESEVAEEQAFEYLSELLRYDYTDPTVLDRIRVLINKFMKATFGKDAMMIEDISQAKPILDKLQRSLRTGETISVAEVRSETDTERASINPAKLPENQPFKIEFLRTVIGKDEGDARNSYHDTKVFNGKWDFVNWWKYQTNMGKGRGLLRFSNFELIKEDGTKEPVNADAMMRWKLRPPLYKEDKQRIAAEKNSRKRYLIPELFKTVREFRYKEGGEPGINEDARTAFPYLYDSMTEERRARVDALREKYNETDPVYAQTRLEYDIFYKMATLEEVQEATSKFQEDKGIDDAGGITERAAIAFVSRIVSEPDVNARFENQLKDKARALCSVGSGTCAINDKVSLLQMESSLVKQQIGEDPSMEKSVDIAAQSLDLLKQHIEKDQGVDLTQAVENYAQGRQEVMNSVRQDDGIEVEPNDFRMMYDLLVAYTSNGSTIDPNLTLSKQLFASGLKRIQGGATEFISPRRIEAIAKKEAEGTLGMVRGDRANTIAAHLTDINSIFKEYYRDGSLDEKAFRKAAMKREAGVPALARMIGQETTKLANLYLGNTGDPQAVPMDGHFRDQFNIFRGRFSNVDYSEGLVIPEGVRTSSIARLNALGSDVNAMSSDAELFAAIKKLKQEGNQSVRNAAARVYRSLVGNEVEKLRSFDKETEREAMDFARKVAKKMGLTPFQVQQLMYHDGIYSMSSYQGDPFISDYRSAMIRSNTADATSVNLDVIPGEQMGLLFADVDPIVESVMPTPGRKAVGKMPTEKEAASSPLFRTRPMEVATKLRVRGGELQLTDANVNEALSTDATSKRIISKSIDVEQGRKVGVRLNLNVMKNTGVPVQTLHDRTASGEALKYAAAVTVKNAELYVNQNAREKIVTFQENKFPMASVNGEFVESGTDLNYDGVRAKFNPFRHNVFVDMAGRPVKSAEEATIIGSDVYLRGKIEYYDMSDPILKRGTVESEASRTKRTTRGAKYDKSLKRFEAYAKGVAGMEFESRQQLEDAFDNMVIPSSVAMSESQVLANMGDAMERASIANGVKRMRRTAKKQARVFEGDVRSQIIKDPRNFITPQKLKNLKRDVQDLSDAELIDIVNDEQLGRISTMNDNLGVLAQAERLARAVARGEADQIPELVAEMSAMGTTAGRLLRHFREVKKSSPAGLAATIKAAAEAKGNVLTEKQNEKLNDLTGRLFEAQAVVEDLKSRAIKGEKVGLDLDDAVKRLKAIEREMDTFTNVIIERGWGELLGQIAQGNLLTTMSQATNVEANGVNSVFDVGVDLAAAPVKAFMTSLSRLAGKEYDAERRASLGAYFYAMTHMGKNFVDTIDQVITGQDKDSTEWRQSRSLMPFRSMMAALKGEDIPARQRAKLAVQGSLGVPAEVMFRLLSLGDTPFRKYFEDKNLYEQAMQKGLEGEALADFLKHPPRKEAEQARTAGRRITFQEETAFSKGVSETIGFFERTLGNAIDAMQSRVDGQQVSKALFRFMIPFRSTPANILIETATFASPVIAAARASAEIKKGNLDEASRHVAKGMVGAVISEAALMMMAEGILSGPIQWDEDEEKNLAYDQFPPTSINISALKRMLAGEETAKQEDDVFMNYMKLGIPGALMAAISVGYSPEEIRERDYSGPIDFAKYMFNDMVGIGPMTAAAGMMEQSFLQGMNEFLQILVGNRPERSAERLLTSIANVGMSVALPNQFSAMYRAQREFLPDRRVTKDMDFGERLMANLEYTVKDRTFGGAEIPVRTDWKGNPIKQNPRGNVGWFYQLFDVTKIRQGEADPVSQEIYRLFEQTEQVSKVVSTPSFAKKRKLSVPNISSKKEKAALRAIGREYSFLNDQEFVDSGVYLNTEQLNRLMTVAGKERYQDVSNLIQSIDYEYLTDDERLERLDEINGEYNSSKEFDGNRFKNHTITLLDIMQEIYESGEQEED
jgi:hypothetical protein